jgi:UDP-2-acetamido-3-amino-2,3-dideoxy-glucuronate N-acetyltransferase
MTGQASSTEKSYWAHETAIVDAGAQIGAGTKLWHWVHVQGNSIIGESCSLGQNVYVGKAVVGNNVKIQNNVSVYDAVRIEDDVFCGPSMVFTNVINPRSHIIRKHEYKETLVRKGATIGANAVIVCGNTIGRYAMVGAGSVVTKDVPEFALVIGNPARQVGWMCQCGVRLEFESGVAHCSQCEWKYKLVAGKCIQEQ